jgi:hypothetical protein
VVELRLDLTDARELDLEFFDELSDLRRQQGDLAGVTLPGGSGRARWSGWAGRSGLPRWAAWASSALASSFRSRGLRLCHGSGFGSGNRSIDKPRLKPAGYRPRKLKRKGLLTPSPHSLASASRVAG